MTEKDNRRLPIFHTICECSSHIKSPMLHFYMQQVRKGYEPSYGKKVEMASPCAKSRAHGACKNRTDTDSRRDEGKGRTQEQHGGER